MISLSSFSKNSFVHKHKTTDNETIDIWNTRNWIVNDAC